MGMCTSDLKHGRRSDRRTQTIIGRKLALESKRKSIPGRRKQSSMAFSKRSVLNAATPAQPAAYGAVTSCTASMFPAGHGGEVGRDLELGHEIRSLRHAHREPGTFAHARRDIGIAALPPRVRPARCSTSARRQSASNALGSFASAPSSTRAAFSTAFASRAARACINHSRRHPFGRLARPHGPQRNFVGRNTPFPTLTRGSREAGTHVVIVRREALRARGGKTSKPSVAMSWT